MMKTLSRSQIFERPSSPSSPNTAAEKKKVYALVYIYL